MHTTTIVWDYNIFYHCTQRGKYQPLPVGHGAASVPSDATFGEADRGLHPGRATGGRRPARIRRGCCQGTKVTKHLK